MQKCGRAEGRHFSQGNFTCDLFSFSKELTHFSAEATANLRRHSVCTFPFSYPFLYCSSLLQQLVTQRGEKEFEFDAVFGDNSTQDQVSTHKSLHCFLLFRKKCAIV